MYQATGSDRFFQLGTRDNGAQNASGRSMLDDRRKLTTRSWAMRSNVRLTPEATDSGCSHVNLVNRDLGRLFLLDLMGDVGVVLDPCVGKSATLRPQPLDGV